MTGQVKVEHVLAVAGRSGILASILSACGSHSNTEGPTYGPHCSSAGPDGLQLRVTGPTADPVSYGDQSLPGGVVVCEWQASSSIAFPLLVSAGGLVVELNSGLTGVKMPSLTTLTVSLSVHDNPELVVLDLPTLASVGEISITNNPKLPQCQLDRLHDQLVAAGWNHQAYFYGNDDAATCP
jgi:hypothetical protein